MSATKKPKKGLGHALKSYLKYLENEFLKPEAKSRRAMEREGWRELRAIIKKRK